MTEKITAPDVQKKSGIEWNTLDENTKNDYNNKAASISSSSFSSSSPLTSKKTFLNKLFNDWRNQVKFLIN